MPSDAPLLFVISGPSGSGKGTLLHHLQTALPALHRVQTYTTRGKRPNETDADYQFISQERFDGLVSAGELFEYTRTYEDHCYGSPKALIEDTDQRDYVVELEVKGMLRLRARSRRQVVGLFILPSSLAELERRILARHAEENFGARMAKSVDQIGYAHAYDYLLVNDDRDKFLADAVAAVRGEIVKRDGFRYLKERLPDILQT